MTGPGSFNTIEEFLAHARALENESEERYRELADAMEVHNNPEVADLFRKLSRYSRKHAAEVEQHAANMALPHIDPWDFKWVDDEGPESGDYAGVHYRMRPAHALQLAMHNETRGRDYYQMIADDSPNPAVRLLAQEFADEESGHVAMLQKWIDRTDSPPEEWDEDPDPPHMPD